MKLKTESYNPKLHETIETLHEQFVAFVDARNSHRYDSPAYRNVCVQIEGLECYASGLVFNSPHRSLSDCLEEMENQRLLHVVLNRIRVFDTNGFLSFVDGSMDCYTTEEQLEYANVCWAGLVDDTLPK